jgi:hypothetical protein
MEQHELVGLWKLTAMRRVDAAGNTAEMDVRTGQLMYTPDGWMTEGLEYVAPGSDVTTSMFYSGRYEISGDAVTHLPAIHTNHQLAGTRQPRQFRIDGNRFTLIAGNPTGTAYLEWERVSV